VNKPGKLARICDYYYYYYTINKKKERNKIEKREGAAKGTRVQKWQGENSFGTF
jgi:hypothetical protein